VTDGENGGDDSVDPKCIGNAKVKDQDLDEAHGKNEGGSLFQRCGAAC